MHRFYMFHSFTRFHRNELAACALFLAAKVEEQPRKLEYVIKCSYACLHRESPALDTKSEVSNGEFVIMQTYSGVHFLEILGSGVVKHKASFVICHRMIFAV